MELRGPRVLLRPPRWDDAHDLFPLAADPEIAQYVYWEPHRSIEDTYNFLRSIVDLEGMYVIEVGQKAAGITGLHYDWPNHTGETETWVGRPYWGSGINTEAKVVLFDHAFGINIRRIQSITHVDNVRSQRALEKLGFRQEGLLRRYRWIRGEPWDLYMYSLLPEEWMSSRPRLEWG